jgi:hypothetical protein
MTAPIPVRPATSNEHSSGRRNVAARQNALSELTRFWLEGRHGCFIRESVPVAVPYGQSELDFMAFRADGMQLRLPAGETVGPRLVIETKDEHDFDPDGRNFAKCLLRDAEALGDDLFVPVGHPQKVAFTMLRQQHFDVATRIFGTNEFDRVFVVHALAEEVREQVADRLRKKRIHWVTVRELLDDLRQWYRTHDRPTGLRHTLTGDIFHLLFGYCGVKP